METHRRKVAAGGIGILETYTAHTHNFTWGVINLMTGLADDETAGLRILWSAFAPLL